MSLSLSHPQAPALDVLDLALQGRQSRLADLGVINPTSAFGQLIAATFDRGMAPEDWQLIDSPSSSLALIAALHDIWRDEVLAEFAARYSLTLRATEDARWPHAWPLHYFQPRRPVLALHAVCRDALQRQRRGLQVSRRSPRQVYAGRRLQRLGARTWGR